MDEPTVVVGRITKAHGVRGEVSVENRSDNPDRWVPGSIVFDPDGRALTVRTVSPHGARLLVTFEGIEDRTAAEGLRGTDLLVPEDWLPPLPEGSWWSYEATGCTVSTESGRVLGTVAEVLAYPAQDLWRGRRRRRDRDARSPSWTRSSSRRPGRAHRRSSGTFPG